MGSDYTEIILASKDFLLLKSYIAKILEYKVSIKLKFKFIHVAMCSLVMSLWPHDFLLMSLYYNIITIE